MNRRRRDTLTLTFWGLVTLTILAAGMWADLTGAFL